MRTIPALGLFLICLAVSALGHAAEDDAIVGVGAALVVEQGSLLVNDADSSGGLGLMLDLDLRRGRFSVSANAQRGLALGMDLAAGAQWRIDAYAAPKMSVDLDEGDDFVSQLFYDRLKSRGFDAHVGLRLSGHRQAWHWALEAGGDVSGRHGGAAVSAQVQREWWLSGWSVAPYGQLMWMSDRMADYYLGVPADQASTRFVEHRQSAGALGEIGVWLERPLGRHWVTQLGLSRTDVSESLRDSPLVNGDHHDRATFGIVYYF